MIFITTQLFYQNIPIDIVINIFRVLKSHSKWQWVGYLFTFGTMVAKTYDFEQSLDLNKPTTWSDITQFLCVDSRGLRYNEVAVFHLV